MASKTFTRTSAKGQFEHVLDKVLELDPGDKLRDALDSCGYKTILDILSMNEKDIEDLAYEDSNQKWIPLLRGSQVKIRSFLGLMEYRSKAGTPVLDVTDLTADDLHAYLTEYRHQLGTVVSVSKKEEQLERDYDKSLKRDPSLFPTLKDFKNWDAYHRSLTIQLAAQDYESIMDPKYKPSTAHQKRLFKRQNRTVLAIFDSTLRADKAKEILREHQGEDYAAQLIYRDLLKHGTESTRASISSAQLLTYITSTRLGQINWRGTYESFLIHWCAQLSQYEEITGKAPFDDVSKITLLQNAVSDVPDMNAVRDMEQYQNAISKNALNFEAYYSLVQSVASRMDHAASQPGTKQARKVFNIDTHVDDVMRDLAADDSDDDDGFLQVNKTRFKDRIGMMGSDLYRSLSPSDRTHWNSITDSVRESILNARVDQPNGGTKKPNGRSPTSVNLADMSAMDYLNSQLDVNLSDISAQDYLSALRDAADDGPPSDEPTKESDNEDTVRSTNSTQIRQVHYTKSDVSPDGHTPTDTDDKPKSLPPGHLLRILSTSLSKPPTPDPKPKVEVNQSASKDLTLAGQRVTFKDQREVDHPTSADLKARLQRFVKTHEISRRRYSVSQRSRRRRGALVDRGANGIVFGNDVRVFAQPIDAPRVDIIGYDDHGQHDVRIASAGGVTTTQVGPAILVFHQGANHGKGKSILSPAQLEAFGSTICDKSRKHGGMQCICTPGGYVIPISIRQGLPYIPLRPYTDEEWDTLPHIILTADEPWHPSAVDYDPLEDDDNWVDALQDLLPTGVSDSPHNRTFDREGTYRHDRYSLRAHETDCFFDTSASNLDDTVERLVDNHSRLARHDHGCAAIFEVHETDTQPRSQPIEVVHKPPDYEAVRPLFGWFPADIIKRTFQCTTQYARMPMSTTLKKTYRTPFPAANVHRRDEDVASDFVYSNTPAVDSGATQASIFVGRRSHVTDVYPQKTDSDFVHSLQDNIRERGAPNRLLTDQAQAETGNRVKDILRYLLIGSWFSEAYQQHQNFCERRINTIKHAVNRLMDRTGSPPDVWLLCLLYVCFLLNHMWDRSLRTTPMCNLTGSTTDISPLCCFAWWEPVYYKLDDSDFGTNSPEGRGRWVGIAENVGHVMTFKILTDDTRRVISRGRLRSALNPQERNLRLDPLNDDTSTPIQEFIHSLHPPSFDLDNGEILHGDVDAPSTPDLVRGQQPESRHDSATAEPSGNEPNSADSEAPPFHPNQLVGRTFLMEPREDGQRFRARIVEALDEHDERLNSQASVRQFRVSVNDDEYEDLLTYEQVIQYITAKENNDGEIVWRFKRIVSHQGPLRSDHPDYKGSSWNVLLEWENGEITSEPIGIIAKDDPVTLAQYALDNGLLDTPGWKRFRDLAKRQKKMLRLVNQAKLRSYRESKRYKFGYEIPKDYLDAVRLDEQNNNTRWQDSVDIEMDQIHSYDTFRDLGKDAAIPNGYKKIRVHLVFDCKADGRHKARLVADGHLTDVPAESVYSGVISLRGLRLLIFLAELNGQEVWSTDIGNAYLEALTKEKLAIIAGPEFGKLQGHTLIVYKALYGLRTSGLRWHEKLAAHLRAMGFSPCKAEPDIWMREKDGLWEYIGVYVDDLAIASKDPQAIINVLEQEYRFKLKGTGPIDYHLGCDFKRDSDGVLRMQPQKFIERMVEGYERHFGSKPSTRVTSPLEKGDHPELDTSEFLTEDMTRVYQSLIGSIQWAVSLARLDVASAVMTLSTYRAKPRKGHLERAKRVVGYLYKMKTAAIRFRVDEPDYSDIPVEEYEWGDSVYGAPDEVLPHDLPKPLGKYVRITHYVDANLYHDYITGRSVTGIIDFLNGTPVDYYAKKQNTVETATYGSEFSAGRTCVERSIDLRTTLRYLGVPIRKEAYMFGDNESVVNSSNVPHAKLHKRHNALSFHRVREAIAMGIVRFVHMPGAHNPADMLSKHWGMAQTWPQLQPLLFQSGDPSETKSKSGSTK